MNEEKYRPVSVLSCVSKPHEYIMFDQLTEYSETWELGTPKGLSKTVLNSEVVLFLRFISMY